MKKKKDSKVKSDNEFMKESFIKYLKDYDQKSEIIECAELINWNGILALFNSEYNSLWDRFKVPKEIEFTKKNKVSFGKGIFLSSKEKLFHSVFIVLKNATADKLSDEEIQIKIDNFYRMFIREVFGVFHYQYNLTSLNYNDDSNIIIPKLEELHKHAKQGKKFTGKNNKRSEIVVFKKMIDRYKKEHENDLNLSYRSLAFYYAKTELGLIYDKEHENFYKRFNTYLNKQK